MSSQSTLWVHWARPLGRAFSCPRLLHRVPSLANLQLSYETKPAWLVRAVLHWTIGPLELQLNNWVNHEPWTDPFVPVRFSQFRPSLQCLPWNWFEATPGSGEALQKGQVFWAFPWRGHGGDFPISVRWQPEMASCLPANLTPWMCWKRTCRLGRFSLGWDKCELFCHVLPWFARSSVITQHK